MTQQELMKGILFINAYYSNFNFDLKNTLKLQIWYEVFKNVEYKDFEKLIQIYAQNNPDFAPNSPMSLLKYLEHNELGIDEAWDLVRSLNKRYGLNYEKSKANFYKELESYPVLASVVKDYEQELKQYSGDSYVAKQFKDSYQVALKNKSNNVKNELLSGTTTLVQIENKQKLLK